MDPHDHATLLWNNELLATLIKRMAAAGILNEHGADAMAEETRAHAASRFPEHAALFATAAEHLRVGIREEIQHTRSKG